MSNNTYWKRKKKDHKTCFIIWQTDIPERERKKRKALWIEAFDHHYETTRGPSDSWKRLNAEMRMAQLLLGPQFWQILV